ncbi:HNH endonuclease signature motif containing protein [Microbacterium telephonicum]|uniref:HNH endonuclease signature motif containing protein n=1 Tax=Microbacterium telephonicum TaxID=1714841 RepID=UPI003BAF5424
MTIVAQTACPEGHNTGRRNGGCIQCLRDKSRAYAAKRRAENRDLVAPETPEELERFWAKVDKSGSCWVWTAAQSGRGYGSFTLRSKPLLAHRIAYYLAKGAHDTGLELDHLCRNRICCNPDHLEAVTHTENMRRSPLATKTGDALCRRGHNDWVEYPGSPGNRHCRTCNVERKRNLRARATSR